MIKKYIRNLYIDWLYDYRYVGYRKEIDPLGNRMLCFGFYYFHIYYDTTNKSGRLTTKEIADRIFFVVLFLSIIDLFLAAIGYTNSAVLLSIPIVVLCVIYLYLFVAEKLWEILDDI